ncbi:hypothetical protein DL96DRAFT_1668547 [Flagelloscypha sp. PMI_526]|nr:hypothetical protein DL96DRAFT_1668547 [Flagelloscypha sp. PMI_526]
MSTPTKLTPPWDFLPVDISSVEGNAHPEVKRMLAQPYGFGQEDTGFAGDIARRLKLVEASLIPKAEEPKKLEARVVFEIDAETDMLNGGGNIHGGCSAFLVDWCSTAALGAYTYETTGRPQWGVSQSISTVYHSPAAYGDKLRIVNTTLTVGSRVVSARTEIWNATHHRLVVSGIHVKMQPSGGAKL